MQIADPLARDGLQRDSVGQGVFAYCALGPRRLECDLGAPGRPRPGSVRV